MLSGTCIILYCYMPVTLMQKLVRKNNSMSIIILLQCLREASLNRYPPPPPPQPHYKESAVYLVRFRQYLSRALGLVKQHVVTTLKTTTRAVQPKQVRAWNFPLEGTTELKFVAVCSSCRALSDGILFWESQNFDQKPWTIVHGLILESPKKGLRNVCNSKGNEKRNLMALFTRIAPSSEELQAFEVRPKLTLSRAICTSILM